MSDEVKQAVDWDAPLEAYRPDSGRAFAVELDRRDHHVCYLRYHPYGETVYYNDGTAYDDESEWRIRNRLASTAQPEVKALVEALETAIGLLWEHCEGIAPRIEPLEQALAAYHETQS